MKKLDKPLKILLVEDEPEECEAFVQYIASLGDVKLADVTNDAEKAVKLVKYHLPDAVILDLELHKGSGNGITFLNELKQQCSHIFPFVLVTTNNISSTVYEHIKTLGADFTISKAQSDYSAKMVVDFLVRMKGSIQKERKAAQSNEVDSLSPHEKEKKLLLRIKNEMDIIGISPKLIGRSHLIDAIMLTINDCTSSVSEIAKKNNKNKNSVEKAMQTAIDKVWTHEDIEVLKTYYTTRISSAKGVPTVTEFIYYYADKIKSDLSY